MTDTSPRDDPGPITPDPDPRAAARDRALSYLDRRMRSRRELRRYLERAGYAADVVEDTLAAMTELGVLDDAAFARAFARDRVRLAPRGYRLIARELAERGVAREVVDAVLTEVEAEFPEVEIAEALLVRKRRHRGDGELTEAETRKLERYLAGRGFRHDTIRRVVGGSDPWTQ